MNRGVSGVETILAKCKFSISYTFYTSTVATLRHQITLGALNIQISLGSAATDLR